MNILCSCAITPKQGPTTLTHYPVGWPLENSTKHTEGMFAYISLWNGNAGFLERRYEECEKIGSPLVVKGDQSLVSKGRMYWLYRNEKNTVVFSLELLPVNDLNRCTLKILEKRQVVIRRTNSKWPYPFNNGFVKWDSRYSTSHKEIKGIKARCRNVDIMGLSGYGECSSENNDLTHGMMLSQWQWSDDLSDNSPALEVEIVTSHALFDANVFTQYESWSGKTNK